ncbi:MAG: type II secretion system F family protein [Planctomycetota bacterium]
MSVLAWSLAGGAILVLLAGVIGVVGSPLLGVPSPLLAIFAVMVVARLVGRARQRRSLTIVGHLEQAARLNLPLPPMLRAAERGEGGAARRRLGDLGRAVEAGMPVGEALEHYAPEVAGRDRREIAVNERIGRLAPALTRVHRRTLRRLRSESGEHDASLGWSYAASLSAFLLLLLGWIAAYILPKYVEIFDDFETPMPGSTTVTFAVGRSLSWWLLGVSVAAVCLMAGGALRSIGRPGSGEWARLPGVVRLVDRVPVVGRMLRDRSWATAYATAGDALAAGYPAPESLRLAADAVTGRRVRGQLTRMAEAMDNGSGFAAAAELARLPGLSRGLLGALDHGGDAPDTLAFLSRYHGSRFSRSAGLLRASVLPAVVIVLSVVVGWVVYSLILPLVVLIYSVTPNWEVL